MIEKYVRLETLIAPAALRRAEKNSYPILSMTMHGGLIDQADKFKKRVASADTSQYKIVRRNQLVVGFPIDEGVLSFQDLYDEAIVSPAYDIWDVTEKEEVDTGYLERFLRSPRALAFYRAKLRGTTARRRTLPDDIFLLSSDSPSVFNGATANHEDLDHAEALRAKRQAALARLDPLTRSIFSDLFGDPTSNAKGVPIAELGTLLKVKSGDFLPATAMAEHGVFPVMGGNGISGYHDSYMFESPQIVIGRVGVYCGCVQVSPAKSWITDNALYVSERSEELEFDYLVHALQFANLNRYASQFGQPLVSAARIYPVEIFVPNRDSQREFSRRIATVEALRTECESFPKGHRSPVCSGPTMRFSRRALDAWRVHRRVV